MLPYDYSKLIAGISEIGRLPETDLRDPVCLISIIRGIGLKHDSRALYGADDACMNLDGGLWQIPDQFANFLVLLSGLRVRRAVEIGTGTGWTAAVLAAYLRRWDPAAHVTSWDVCPVSPHLSELESLLPILFRQGTSHEAAREPCDLCFIDGGHDYPDVRADYEQIGRLAPVCAFHDVNDRLVEEHCPLGGVPVFWRKLVRDEWGAAAFHEYLWHSEGRRVMGIGVRVRRPAGEF